MKALIYARQSSGKDDFSESVEAQIAKMRELYAQLPEKPDWLSPETIDAYARRMAAPEQPEETRILDEALGAHSGQIDMLMQAVRGELTVGTLRYSIFEERPHINDRGAGGLPPSGDRHSNAPLSARTVSR